MPHRCTRSLYSGTQNAESPVSQNDAAIYEESFAIRSTMGKDSHHRSHPALEFVARFAREQPAKSTHKTWLSVPVRNYCRALRLAHHIPNISYATAFATNIFSADGKNFDGCAPTSAWTRC